MTENNTAKAIMNWVILAASISLVLLIMLILFGNLSGNIGFTSTLASNTVANETGGYINSTGYTIDNAGASGFTNFVVTSIYSDSFYDNDLTDAFGGTSFNTSIWNTDFTAEDDTITVAASDGLYINGTADADPGEAFSRGELYSTNRIKTSEDFNLSMYIVLSNTSSTLGAGEFALGGFEIFEKLNDSVGITGGLVISDAGSYAIALYNSTDDKAGVVDASALVTAGEGYIFLYWNSTNQSLHLTFNNTEVITTDANIESYVSPTYHIIGKVRYNADDDNEFALEAGAFSLDTVASPNPTLLSSTLYSASSLGVITNSTPYLFVSSADVSYTYTSGAESVAGNNAEYVIGNYSESAVNTAAQLPTTGTIIGVALLLFVLIALLVFAIKQMTRVSGSTGRASFG